MTSPVLACHSPGGIKLRIGLVGRREWEGAKQASVGHRCSDNVVFGLVCQP